ncbi:hypothetical protein ALQ36_103553 [Pseudomonas syringae pv. primulae]|uniref:Uncharacterized protein n=1 Tax=Pseudomonas syringae pv. primulae TaxID=251707 RepID=A0A3M3Y7U0_9PSED|nr:hypothetical protein ALQ36_103553 [Pseudomonas syringae pv. primulae]RMU31896.1 hypothetical protein ALP30_104090 [Pseudomonas syringae pv. primulae]
MDIFLDIALDLRRTTVRAGDENPPDASGAGVAIFIFQSRT